MHTIAIIGGGFSGSMVAFHLATKATKPLRILLIERKESVGRGIAYSTSSDEHLLNVQAKNMSALPNHPDHFVKWLERYPDLSESSFAPRRIYGEYVQSVLEPALHKSDNRVEVVHAEALSISKGEKALVELSDGWTIEADAVVLAIGHFPPGHPSAVTEHIAHSKHYAGNPWSALALKDLKAEDVVLMVGTGLTAIDLVLSLKERGHHGTIHLVSPRGLLPLPHGHPKPHELTSLIFPNDIRELVKFVKHEMKVASKNEGDWRSVIHALRPHYPKIWSGLSLRDRRRFLKFVRPLFEVHRHRLPEPVYGKMSHLINENAVQLHQGVVKHLEERNGELEVTIRSQKESTEHRLLVSRVINCTGPMCDYRRMRHPLIMALLEHGYATVDPLALGVDADESGAVISASGDASDWLFTLGPTLKGKLWETTAVPELRIQADRLAKTLLSVLFDDTPVRQPLLG